MVENVEELSPELGMDALPQMPILSHRKIEVAKSGIAEGVAAHVSELTQSWRDHDRIALGVAAKQCQRVGCRPRSPSIQAQSLRVACSIVGGIGLIVIAREEGNGRRARFKI